HPQTVIDPVRDSPPAHVFLEPAVRGSSQFEITQIKSAFRPNVIVIAEQGGRVAPFIQQFTQRADLSRNFPGPEVSLMTAGKRPSEHRSVGGNSPHRGGDRVQKEGALLSQAVQYWAGQVRIAVATEMISAQRVKNDKEDIWSCHHSHLLVP